MEKEAYRFTGEALPMRHVVLPLTDWQPPTDFRCNRLETGQHALAPTFCIRLRQPNHVLLVMQHKRERETTHLDVTRRLLSEQLGELPPVWYGGTLGSRSICSCGFSPC